VSLDLDALLAAAKTAANAGGEIVRANFGAPPDVREKAPGDWVTAADTASEDAVRAVLERETGLAVFGEEAGGTRADTGWLVDPLDGTANFVHGYPYYAISIALTHGGEVTHAVVLDPVRDELFTAIKGKGAQQNGTPIRTSTCVRLEEALVGTVFPTRTSSKLPAYLPVFDALIRQCAGIRRAGAGALDLAYVAAGRLDGFWVMSQKPWDVVAGALIVNEAGGRVGDFAGGKDFVRTNEVIASAPGIFNLLRETIAAAGPIR
jgi:myo-inositol-1(or 4)-monophosphatase